MKYRDTFDDRFDFSEKGSFRSINNYHKYIRIFIIAVCVILSLFWCRITFIHIQGAGLFHIFVIAIGVIIISAIGATISALLNISRTWRYKADINGMLLSCGEKKKYYAYKDVKAVSYEMNKAFGKESGLDISVATKTSVDSYTFSSTAIDPEIAFEKSPFYILKYPPEPKISKEEAEYYELLRR